MNKQNLIFWLIIGLIGVLTVASLRIHYLGNGFLHDCVNFYNLSNGCPCEVNQISNSFNFSNINFTYP